MDILEWPAQLPDLSPIEMVWVIIEMELGGIQTLKLLIETAWQTVIMEEVLDRLIESMPASSTVSGH